MLEIYQKTTQKTVNLRGIGLHSGNETGIKILPGKANQGIIFKRVDLKINNLVKANYKNVTSAKLCTTLENDHGVKVSTVEHLLAAFYINGIDNALVEIDNEEVPIMDGSAKDFLNILKEAGVKKLDKKIKYLKLSNKVSLTDGQRNISIEPNNSNFEVDFQLNYKNQIIGDQRNNVNFHKDNLEDVSNSRTFCLYQDIEHIKKMGLAKGGSLDNALVVDSDKVLNKGGLRNEKEFVNHKILDLAGDFLLSGYRILGKVICYQGGHELTNTFLRKLLKHSAIKIVELENVVISENSGFKQPLKIAANA